MNDRELFSELFDNPINPLLIHMVPPFADKKDPMFHLQINGEAIWKWRVSSVKECKLYIKLKSC